MKRKRTLLTFAVLAAMLCLSFAGVMFAASAASATVTVTPNVRDYENAGEATTNQKIDFVDTVGMSGNTYFVSQNDYTGAYTFDFSVYTNAGGYTGEHDFEFRLGTLVMRKDVSGLYLLSDDAIAVNKKTGDRYECNSAGSQVLRLRDFADLGFLFGADFYFRFEICADGGINIYCSNSVPHPETYGVRYEISWKDNANSDFSITDGKVAIVPCVGSSDAAGGTSARRINGAEVITQKAEVVTDSVNQTFAGAENFDIYDLSGVEGDVYTTESETTMVFTPEKIHGNEGKVKIASKQKMTGAYTVDFALYNNDGGTSSGPVFGLQVGDKNPSDNADITDKNNNVTFRINTTSILTASDATVVSLQSALGYYDSQTLYLRLQVKNDGNIDVYCAYAPLGDEPVLRKTLEIDNADFSLTDGYVSVIPMVNNNCWNYGDGNQTQYRVRKFVSLGLNGTYVKQSIPEVKDVLFDESGLNKAQIIGSASNYSTASFAFDYCGDTRLASKYAFTSAGLKDDGTVFSVSFNYAANSANDRGLSLYRGFMFGLDAANANKSSASYVEVATQANGTGALRVYKNGTQVGEDIAIDVYVNAATSIWNITAKKDGTLTVDVSNMTGGAKVYEGFDASDFEGKIAFYTGGAATRGQTVSVTALSISGNMTVTVASVKVDASAVFGAQIGDEVTLGATSTFNVSNVLAPQGITDSFVFSVTEGSDRCTLDGNKLTITAAGYIKIRATSVLDPTKYDEYRFYVIGEKQQAEYDLIEDFSEYNDADWTIVSSREEGGENVGVRNGSLYLTVDYTDGDFANRDSLVSKVVFEPSDTDNVVFDITFSAAYAGLSLRKDSIGWGLTFGMKSENAKAFDDGVGYLRVNYISTAAYIGDTKIEPTYIKNGGSEQGGIFCADSMPYRVRLVAKKDGTLDLYRAMSGFGYEEKIDELLATYEGFDFNGYIGFTSDVKGRPDDNGQGGEARDRYDVIIYDVSLSGNIGYGKDSEEVKRVVIDESVFRDAIVSEIPIELKAEAYAVPNIALFKGVVWSVAENSKDKAAIEDGKLTVTGAGSITVRATSATDGTKFADFTFEAIVLNITGVTIVGGDDIFNGVTNDTQPIDLSAVVECNSIANKYQEVKWEVVSGPAEVVLNQLRITGVGEVTLKVTAVYDESVYKEVTFTVADNDKNIEPAAKKKGCKNSVSDFGGIGAACVAVSVLGIAFMLLRKKRA